MEKRLLEFLNLVGRLIARRHAQTRTPPITDVSHSPPHRAPVVATGVSENSSTGRAPLKTVLTPLDPQRIDPDMVPE